MTRPNDPKHKQRIMEQFSKQAIPFSRKVPAHSNEAAFDLILSTVGIGQGDTVLDVACGPGMLTAAAARKADHVTGIDLVPAMLKQARRLQKEKGLGNMNWIEGDVTQLPFEDAAFSAVLTRFSFHHFLKPRTVLREMVRVARPGGRVGVIDVFTTSAAHSRLYNRIEKLRDDSHVKALSLRQLKTLMRVSGLTKIETAFYRLEISLEQQLKASFPQPGDDVKIRRLVGADLRKGSKSLVSVRKDGTVFLFYPIAVLAGTRA